MYSIESPKSKENILVDENDKFIISKSFFIGKNQGKFKDCYTPGTVLGEGAFGEVRKCQHKTTKVVRAVKLVKKDNLSDNEIKALEDEIEILCKLDHPNIIKIFEIYTDDKRYYIVTELCKGGELFDEILKKEGGFTEKEAAVIIKQILQAIAYCHDLKIVHRDIKPENVLVDTELNNTLKIIDFGISIKMKDNEKLSDVKGTSYYIAPEVFEKNYNEKCDVWSIGVIMYILLAGEPPFNGKDDKVIERKVKTGVYSMD